MDSVPCTYIDKGLDVLEDIVNVVDGEAEGLRDLELGVVVLAPGDALDHLVRVEDGRLAHVLTHTHMVVLTHGRLAHVLSHTYGCINPWSSCTRPGTHMVVLTHGRLAHVLTHTHGCIKP